MFLLRVGFWLAVIVFLLPSDPQQQARLRATATGAMDRVTTYCDRNAGPCMPGGDVWDTFVRKAEFGLQLVGDLIGGGRQPPDAAPLPQRRRGAGRGDPYGTQPPDLYEPAWRGPPWARGG